MTSDATPKPADLLAAMPFAARLGMDLTEATSERTTGTLPWSADLCTAGDTLHGGALMALADTVGAVCAFLNLPEGASTSTVESKTNFFRPVRSGRARAVARPLHVGRGFIVVQTDVYDADGRAVGQTTQTQTVRGA
ncbi:PaaI family thioesterase [Streptomyces sp. A7024]|uniref:PaaI family thioesterase n=1 Tax=Streptomyces coryli TaxID=1128680 RepID=A0A6G4TWC7_9ACTN|nr:PaaI family thioesterase [Streptomyces coryli]NGN63347.1 PaaI family thioesterase [Streptomyces coryli]